MATGAGGSIGSELCRQLASFSPASILVCERGEFHLYTLVEEFNEGFPHLRVEAVIGDTRDESRLVAVIGRNAPVVVFQLPLTSTYR